MNDNVASLVCHCDTCLYFDNRRHGTQRVYHAFFNVLHAVVSPPAFIYMGRDKYENEELIKYGWPDDVWCA